jgi:hypothetical protein
MDPTWFACKSQPVFGGQDRNRTDVQGFAVLCMTTLPPGLKVYKSSTTNRLVEANTFDVLCENINDNRLIVM